MMLPMQSHPVQRVIVSYSTGDAVGPESNSIYATGSGVVACCNVAPCGWLDDIGRIAGTVGQVAGTLGPVLGAFGI